MRINEKPSRQLAAGTGSPLLGARSFIDEIRYEEGRGRAASRGSRIRNEKFGARLRYIPGHDYDEQPKKAKGFESFHDGFGKSFTDVLGPLSRYLHSNLGRPWHKIYSEMCVSLDKRKATGRHIFEHLEHMVELDCYLGDDGKVLYKQYRHPWYGSANDQQVRGFYVHPRTGLLCLAPRRETNRQRRRKEMLAKPMTRLMLGNNMAYQIHEGVWYKVKLMRIVVGYKDPVTVAYDIFLKRKVYLNWGENWVATHKKQCNRRELAEVQRLLEGRQKEAASL
ncbi:MAG: hypothetical protein DMG65_16380 [Candidatus Angelobacter sp. Gp1-AA117]|nr:MAG: hypothetical protein DMG65_16380 [Candidatus Angelobacter sp. Gp1-AA117]